MANKIYDGPIIDAHHHLWTLAENAYPWLRRSGENKTGVPEEFIDIIRHDYLVPQYLADVSGQNVVASVHAEAEPEDARAEIAFLDTQDKSDGVAVSYIGMGNPADADFASLVEYFAANARVSAVRSILSWDEPEESDSRLSTLPKGWIEGVGRLPGAGLALELMTLPKHAADVVEVARSLSSLTIIINHCAGPNGYVPEWEAPWRETLRMLASAENILMKISDAAAGVPGCHDEGVFDVIRSCTNAFGYERCIFGTDFPVAKMMVAAETSFRQAKEALSTATSSEQAKVFYENARELYRINLPR